eukprot:TRINITY_DN6616_c0_g1_i7.p1 TRINITY_DN6616_c0_g1~~TRINITY_DN6616_c0_g1_i7.p1  ORF type:complete len:162 (+),score=30.38 TRINITY_DN6616_c0_g1_i7:48-533(+)
MGRKYYCEVCGKMCPSSAYYKKSHATTLNHVYNWYKYYEQFLDTSKCVLTCPHARKFKVCKCGNKCRYSYYAMPNTSEEVTTKWEVVESRTGEAVKRKRPRKRTEEKKLKEELSVVNPRDIPISMLPKEILEGKKRLAAKLYGTQSNYDYLVRMSHKNKWN